MKPLMAEMSVAISAGASTSSGSRTLGGRLSSAASISANGRRASLIATNMPVTGSVELAGRQLVGASATDLRRVRGSRIAYIFQEPMTSLNPVYTVGHQVVEVLRVHEGMDRRQAQDRAAEEQPLSEDEQDHAEVHRAAHEPVGAALDEAFRRGPRRGRPRVRPPCDRRVRIRR